jgi:pentapeptide MXKDX repeat protein
MSLSKPSDKDNPPMTFRSRIALGVSAAVVSLGLALSPAAFAQDKMSKDDGMKKDAMSNNAMKKDDGMKKDGMKKDDAMSKDGMKKDDAMKKN